MGQTRRQAVKVESAPQRARFTGGHSSVELRITGSPIITLDFPPLPSMNESNARRSAHAIEGGKHTKVWRDTGYYTGKQALALWRLHRNEVLVAGAVLLVWDVYRADLTRRDVINLDTKAVVDGLTDAGYWTDDSERVIRQQLVRYAGLARKAHVTLSIYLLKGD